MGRDGIRHLLRACRFLFQSTRPVWGATICRIWTTSSRRNFNPRAPCGARPYGIPLEIQLNGISIHAPRVGRDLYGQASVAGCIISIHAPRVGRDTNLVNAQKRGDNFNPRAPCGARLQAVSRFHPAFSISIHAPRVGRDSSGQRDNSLSDNFNPRAPCGARRCSPYK